MQSRMAFFSMLIPLSFAVSSCALFDAFTASNTPSALAQSEPQSVQNTPKKPLPKFINDRGQSEPKPSVTVTKEEELPDFTEIDFSSDDVEGDTVVRTHITGDNGVEIYFWTPSLAAPKSCALPLDAAQGSPSSHTFTAFGGENPTVIVAYDLTRQGSGLKADETVLTFQTIDIKTCKASKPIELPAAVSGTGASFYPSLIKASPKVAAIQTNEFVMGFDHRSGEVIWRFEGGSSNGNSDPSWAVTLDLHDPSWSQKVIELDTGKVIYSNNDYDKRIITSSIDWSDKRVLLAEQSGKNGFMTLRVGGFLNYDGSITAFPAEIWMKDALYSRTTDGHPLIVFSKDFENNIWRFNEDGTVTELFSAEQVSALGLQLAGVTNESIIVLTSNEIVELDFNGKETGRKWPRDEYATRLKWNLVSDDVNISCWNGIASRNGKLPWADR